MDIGEMESWPDEGLEVCVDSASVGAQDRFVAALELWHRGRATNAELEAEVDVLNGCMIGVQDMHQSALERLRKEKETSGHWFAWHVRAAEEENEIIEKQSMHISELGAWIAERDDTISNLSEQVLMDGKRIEELEVELLKREGLLALAYIERNELDQRAETAEAEAQAGAYKEGVSWSCSCLNCAKMLTECHKETCAKEEAEAERDKLQRKLNFLEGEDGCEHARRYWEDNEDDEGNHFDNCVACERDALLSQTGRHDD